MNGNGYLLIKTVLGNDNVSHTNTERHDSLGKAKELAYAAAKTFGAGTFPFRILVVAEGASNGAPEELEIYRGDALKPLNRRELTLKAE